MNLNQLWSESCFVAFDTETTGRYPLESEICEIAGVKWQNGKKIAEFQSLVKVSKPMSKEVIEIHHITDDMLIGAPDINQAANQFYEFIQDSILIAHHAPFDLGFLTIEFERMKLPLPSLPVLCSSLLTRKAFPESANHRLQTLIQFLGIEQGQAHRALDDARACLAVAIKCFARIGERATVNDLINYQTLPLKWQNFSMIDLRAKNFVVDLIKAIETHQPIQIVYQGGSRPGEARTVMPIGLVRNPQDDFLVALEEGEVIAKRYFLKRITGARL